MDKSKLDANKFTFLFFVSQDHRGAQLYLGLNHSGVLTFQGSRRTHHFKWHEVQKLNYEGKMFIIHLVFMEVRFIKLASMSV